MRSKGRPSDTFPNELIRPILMGWLKEHSMTDISRRTGIEPRQLYAIVNNEFRTVSLVKADKLFCAMGRPDLFNVELSDVYEVPA